MDFNEIMTKQNELDAMKLASKKALIDEYMKTKEEAKNKLKKMEEEFKKYFGENIDDATKITEDDLKAFIEALEQEPDIKFEDLKAKLKKHPKTIQKIQKQWKASNKTLENLKALLKVA
jgi:hypothetical protein